MGTQPAFAAAATQVGQWIGSHGWQMVYGGGKVGLMGIAADATLAAGGTVFGVIPQNLLDKEVGHTGLTELRVVGSMHERKTLMFERADAFVALAGGIGTFEELFEVWTWRQLGYHNKPIGLLNTEGYYDGLLKFTSNSAAQGFLSEWQMDLIRVGTEAPTLLRELVQAAGFSPEVKLQAL